MFFWLFSRTAARPGQQNPGNEQWRCSCPGTEAAKSSRFKNQMSLNLVGIPSKICQHSPPCRKPDKSPSYPWLQRALKYYQCSLTPYLPLIPPGSPQKAFPLLSGGKKKKKRFIQALTLLQHLGDQVSSGLYLIF